MSSSYWRGASAFVAFGLVAISVLAWLIWDLSASLAEQRVRDEQSAQRHAEYADERVARECGPLEAEALRNCVQEQIEAATDQYRAEQDLRAQESMALFTKIMGYTGLVGLGIGIISIGLIWATLHETQRMANDTQRIGEAQVRAYLRIEAAAAVSYPTGEVGIEVAVRNYGQSPARHVHFVAELTYHKRVEGVEGMEGYVSMGIAYTRPWLISDIPAGGLEGSRVVRFGDIDFHPNTVSHEDGTPMVILANVGVFAADVFLAEIFENFCVVVARGDEQFNEFKRIGAFSDALGFSQSMSAQELQSKGWNPDFISEHKKPKRRRE